MSYVIMGLAASYLLYRAFFHCEPAEVEVNIPEDVVDDRPAAIGGRGASTGDHPEPQTTGAISRGNLIISNYYE